MRVKKPIIVYVDEDIYEKLKKDAEKRGASISQVVREILYMVVRNGKTPGSSDT